MDKEWEEGLQIVLSAETKNTYFVDPQAVGLVIGARDEVIRVVPRPATLVAPVANPRILVSAWPSDCSIRNTNGIIIGREEGVCGLLCTVTAVGNGNVGEPAGLDIAGVGGHPYKVTGLIEESDVGEVASRVVEATVIVEADCDPDGGAHCFGLSKVVQAKLDDPKSAGYDADSLDNCGGHGWCLRVTVENERVGMRVA